MIPFTRLLAAAVLIPVAFELTVRMDDWARYGVPISSGATGVEDLRVVDSLGRHARPGTAFRKYHINALGFRGPEVSAEDLRTRSMVVVSGASESFGLYESEGREWPQQLSDSLNRRCAARPVTVMNAAFVGMALPTVIQDLQRRVLPLHPAVIVYYPEPTQYLAGDVPRLSPSSTDPPPSLSPWRLRSQPRLRDDLKGVMPAALLDYLRRRDTEQERSAGETLFSKLPVERLDSMEAHLRTLVGTARSGGAAIAMVMPQHRFSDTTSVAERRWLRAWERFTPKATGSLILSFSARADERIRAVAADSGVPLVEPRFPAGVNRALMFADPNHFTDRGAAILAAAASNVVSRALGCSG